MKQADALRMIADEEPCWVGMAVRGAYTLYLRKAGLTIPRPVWERLLDLDDLEIVPEMFGTNNQYLRLTEQGRQRLE